jgi:hypothetical protein
MLMKREHFFLISFLVGMTAGWLLLDAWLGDWFTREALGGGPLKMIMLGMLKFNLVLAVGALSFCVPYLWVVDKLLRTTNKAANIFAALLPAPTVAAIHGRPSDSFRPPRNFT